MRTQPSRSFSPTAAARPRLQRALVVLLVALVVSAVSGCGDGVTDVVDDAGGDLLLDSEDYIGPAATDVSYIHELLPDSVGTDAVASDVEVTDVAQTDVVATDVVDTDTAATDATSTDATPLPDDCTADSDCKDPGVPCITARCVPANPGAAGSQKVCKLVLLPDSTPCSDGQSCTAGEWCQTGQCQGGKDVCACNTSSDCAGFEDGNPCNGTLYCDKTGEAPVCKVNPASVVTCEGVLGPCSASLCNPASGKCEVQNAPNGSECNDGDSCSVDDACQAGVCKGGVSICQCKTTADCGAFEDANLCNGKLYCDTTTFPFQCQINPASLVKCPTAFDTACQKNTCQPGSGQCAMVLSADATPCDDNNPCTTGDNCLQGQCKSGTNTCQCVKNADCAGYEDGNACNGSLFCNVTTSPPSCEINPATIVVCASANDTDCKQNQCDPLTGSCNIAAINENGACSDGNLCSVGDHCEQGSCVPAAETCECVSDSDCAPYEDGNACNGTLYCDKSAAPFRCRVNPATVVTCADGDDTACTQNRCDPTTGSCGMTAVHENGPCDADDFDCTAADSCKAGTCVAGTNVCSCESGPDCLPFEDANVCNGSLYCDKTQQPYLCQINPATTKTCPSVDDTECAANTCNPVDGSCVMTPRNGGDVCNADNNDCTVGDVCQAGICEVGTNICACQNDLDCAGADDGNLCNGTFFCNKAEQPFVCALNPATVVNCDKSSDTACVKNTCDAKTGDCDMAEVPDNTGCSDGNSCSVSDVCVAGSCKGTDICSCQTNADCAPFDDGNKCNGGLFCDTSALPYICKPDNLPVVCPNPTEPCLLATCKAATGLCETAADPVQNNKICNDGNPCTASSTCISGVCAGLTDTCNDNDECTFDVCIAGIGCENTQTPNAPCDDNEVCTKQDKCTGTSCVGVPVYCDDDEPCTDDYCASGLGCQYSPNNDLCDDGNACSTKDRCGDGSCEGFLLDCNDGNDCTEDGCEADSGCSQLPLDAVLCEDGDECTDFDTCDMGWCYGQDLCDDGNPCTTDICDSFGGCSSQPLSGIPCNDNNPCTIKESCNDGLCEGLDFCVDDNACTLNGCDPDTGCIVIPLLSGPCDDGDACTQDDACDLSSNCTGAVVTCDGSYCGQVCDPNSGCGPAVPCDDNRPCTIDSCDNLAGCVIVADTDGTPCGKVGGDLCYAGSCASCDRVSLRWNGMQDYDDRFHDGIGDTAGWVAVGESVPSGGGTRSGLITAVSPSGNVQWSDIVSDKGSAGLYAALPGAATVAVFGGIDNGQGDSGQGVILVYDRFSAAKLKSISYGVNGKTETFRSAVEVPGGWVVAGTIGSNMFNGDAVLVEITSTPSVEHELVIPSPAGSGDVRKVIAVPGKGWFIVGTVKSGGQKGWVIHVDENFQLVWEGYYQPPMTTDSQLTDIAWIDGKLLCVGATSIAGIRFPWFLRLDENGAEDANFYDIAYKGLGWTQVHYDGTGLVLAGIQQLEDTPDTVVRIQRIPVTSGPSWDRSVAYGDSQQAFGLIASSTGMAFAGSVRHGLGDSAAWLQEFDWLTGLTTCQ
jgi:hypothetical protein